jgi:hypothetical protein
VGDGRWAGNEENVSSSSVCHGEAFENSENLRDQDAELDARRDLRHARRVELPVRWTWLKSHSTAFNGTHDSVSFHESDIGALRSLRVNATKWEERGLRFEG